MVNVSHPDRMVLEALAEHPMSIWEMEQHMARYGSVWRLSQDQLRALVYRLIDAKAVRLTPDMRLHLTVGQ